MYGPTYKAQGERTIQRSWLYKKPEDYGDAPDTYATTKAASGPYHAFDSDLMVGATWGAETDGAPIAT